MQIGAKKQRDWLIAGAASLALHALLIYALLSVSISPPVQEPVLRLVLKSAPASSMQNMDAPPPAAPAPASRPVSEPKAVIPKPSLKPKAEPAAKPVQKPAEQQKTQPAQAVPTSPAQEEVASFGSDAEPAVAAGGASQSIGNGGAPGSAGAPVDVAQLLITKKVIPEYPSFSRKRGEEGTVKILITILNDGVVSARVHETSGSERLDNSALRAVKQWRFNQREEIRAIVPFVFRLEN